MRIEDGAVPLSRRLRDDRRPTAGWSRSAACGPASGSRPRPGWGRRRTERRPRGRSETLRSDVTRSTPMDESTANEATEPILDLTDGPTLDAAAVSVVPRRTSDAATAYYEYRRRGAVVLTTDPPACRPPPGPTPTSCTPSSAPVSATSAMPSRCGRRARRPTRPRRRRAHAALLPPLRRLLAGRGRTRRPPADLRARLGRGRRVVHGRHRPRRGRPPRWHRRRIGRSPRCSSTATSTRPT